MQVFSSAASTFVRDHLQDVQLITFHPGSGKMSRLKQVTEGRGLVSEYVIFNAVLDNIV